jgi:(5-formylfuran-3-yl)methyl phosphate synthase
MTQLLISVKNVEEALLASEVGVDIVDLKDPNIGALGALGLRETERIVRAVNGLATVSATVGENHTLLDELVGDIQERTQLGVNIIKIGISELFYASDFVQNMQILTSKGLKIVAVFFADEANDFELLEKIKQAGFCGAMLDTKNKQQNLLQLQTKGTLQSFTQICHQLHLKSGLAGSLRPQHIDLLVRFNPTYIGFRGGACENNVRKSALSSTKVTEIKNMLYEHNRLNEKPQGILQLALHS